ncbi:MAG: glycosyltransferase family 39 protein [Minwuiales bacterium]|nr:glycosyltransferase family 39 protein [Minwuiales bacterium]
METAVRRQDTIVALALVTLVAAGMRIAVLPFATTDGGDSIYRVWIALRWLEDPGFITHGTWGPLHFYMLGALMAVIPDTVTAPVLLHVVLGIAAPTLMYAFVRIEFSSHRAALLAALTFAVYPILVRNSVSVRAETPFVLMLLASMVCMALARGNDGRWQQAVAAGLFLTLAGMLRYEAWALIPFMTVMLWRNRRFAAVFLATAMIHPTIWMTTSTIELGHPFASTNWSSTWERTFMARGSLGAYARLSAALGFTALPFKGLTWLVAAASATGAAIAVATRHRSAAWLIPLVALTTLLAISVFRGSLVPKHNYTATIGTMLIPFSALLYTRLGIDRLRATTFALTALLMVGSVLVLSQRPILVRLGLQSIACISPVPTIKNQAVSLSIPAAVTANVDADTGGFISDFYDWGSTPYVALLTRLHPDRIYRAPGAPNRPVDLAKLDAFLSRHPTGVLLIQHDSRFAGAIGFDGRTATVGGRLLRLEPVTTFPWRDRRVRSSPDLELFRYSAEDV